MLAERHCAPDLRHLAKDETHGAFLSLFSQRLQPMFPPKQRRSVRPGTVLGVQLCGLRGIGTSTPCASTRRLPQGPRFALGAFDWPRDPREVMDKLEQRVGPEGRKLLEKFLEQI